MISAECEYATTAVRLRDMLLRSLLAHGHVVRRAQGYIGRNCEVFICSVNSDVYEHYSRL